MIRILKSALMLFVALLCIFYALNNVANLGAMYGSLEYVMSNQDHTAYPASFGPAVSSPILIWFAAALVLAGEFGAGFIVLFGAWKLFSARGASAEEFNAAKKVAILGCGIGMLVWFGFFMAFGGAYFQMWQTAIGGGSHSSAFHFAAVLGIIALFVQLIED